MVQFKKVFLGMEQTDGRPSRRHVAEVRARRRQAQRSRAGGAHGRHHTFFEMLGNFSFGDYFKRDAIRFAWEFVTGPREAGNLGFPGAPARHRYSAKTTRRARSGARSPGFPIHASTALARRTTSGRWRTPVRAARAPRSTSTSRTWRRTGRFPRARPASGPSSIATEFSLEAFVEGAEAGRFLEIWNLVFMQFDKQPDGTLVPLPKPSVDTGAGLERIAAVMQGVTNNFHTELFQPLISAVEEVVGMAVPGP